MKPIHQISLHEMLILLRDQVRRFLRPQHLSGQRYLLKIWQKFWATSGSPTLYSLAVALFLVTPVSAFGLSFTEIMFDPAGTDDNHEYIEIYNDTTTPIDVTTLKLFEGNTNHKITSVRGDGTLGAGEYIIIAQDPVTLMADFPTMTADVVDSSFTLTNSGGESLEIRDASGATLATTSYLATSAAGDGLSLHFIQNTWVPRLPNPGQSPDSAGTLATGGSGGSTTTTSTTSSSTSTTGSASSGGSSQVASIQPYYQILVKTNPDPIVAKIPVRIIPHLYYINQYKQKLEYTSGILEVVTGDGQSYTMNKVGPITHTYGSAGLYRLYLAYKTSTLQREPDVIYEVDISVVNPSVEFSQKDDTLIISNTQQSMVDMSGWVVVSDGAYYTLAPGTKLLPKASISLPYTLSRAFKKGSHISLVLPDKETVVATIGTSTTTVNPLRVNQAAGQTEKQQRSTPSQSVVRDVPDTLFMPYTFPRPNTDFSQSLEPLYESEPGMNTNSSGFSRLVAGGFIALWSVGLMSAYVLLDKKFLWSHDKRSDSSSQLAERGEGKQSEKEGKGEHSLNPDAYTLVDWND